MIEQAIQLSSFSVLIDSNVAAYHLTVTLGCYGTHENSINVGIQFYKENYLWIHGYQSKLHFVAFPSLPSSTIRTEHH